MKIKVSILLIAVVFFTTGIYISSAYAKQKEQTGYILEHEKLICMNNSKYSNIHYFTLITYCISMRI